MFGNGTQISPRNKRKRVSAQICTSALRCFCDKDFGGKACELQVLNKTKSISSWRTTWKSTTEEQSTSTTTSTSAPASSTTTVTPEATVIRKGRPAYTFHIMRCLYYYYVIKHKVIQGSVFFFRAKQCQYNLAYNCIGLCGRGHLSYHGLLHDMLQVWEQLMTL